MEERFTSARDDDPGRVDEDARVELPARIESRRDDQQFGERLRASLERNKKIIEKLAET